MNGFRTGDNSWRNHGSGLVLEISMNYYAAMQRLTRVAAVLVWAGLSGWALAEVRLPEDSPFQVILDRNPFGLHPPPTNVVAVQTSAPPAQVNVNLSGITSAGGVRRAWMVIPAGGTRTNTTCFSMGEGDPEIEGVQVVRIDLQQGMVEIRKNGVPATLDFENQGMSYTGPIAAVAPPQGRRMPGRAGMTVPVPNPGVRVITGNGRSASANIPGAGSTGLANNNTQVIPPRAIRTTQQQATPPMDPAQQILQMKLQELRARQQGVPFPPMPPIPGSQIMDGSQ